MAPPIGGWGGESVFGFQHGGIVRRPTLALIGERGPEAVVPLSKGAMVTINITGPIYGMADFRRQVVQALKDAALTGGFHGLNLGAA